MTILFSPIDVRDMLINYLRANVPDPLSRGSTHTDSKTGDGSTTEFTLTNKAVKYISSVTVDGVAKNMMEDYIVNFKKSNDYAIVKFLTAPANNASISISYGYGSSWIYPDFPRTDAASPRIGVNLVSESTSPSGFTTDDNFYTATYQVSVFVKEGKAVSIVNKDYAGQELAMFLADYTQDMLLNNRAGIMYNVWDIEHVGGNVMWEEDKKFIYVMRDYLIRARILHGSLASWKAGGGGSSI